jgi:2,3-dihydroxybenzoate decarboxylase
LRFSSFWLHCAVSIDYPYESSYEAVQGFERTTLSASDREKVARGNSERLLRIS